MKLNLPLESRYLAGPAILLSVVFILYLLEPTSGQWLSYQRDQVEAGQWWRLITGNFVHSNFTHLLLNGLGVFFIWYIQAEHFTPGRYFGVFLWSCLICGLGVHWVGDLSGYVGLSGALHGVVTYGAVKDIKGKIRFGWPLLIGIMVKVGYENLIGPSDEIRELIKVPVAVEAHLYGMTAGLLAALPTFYRLWVDGVDEAPEENSDH